MNVPSETFFGLLDRAKNAETEVTRLKAELEKTRGELKRLREDYCGDCELNDTPDIGEG
jgi:hypothetical protein